MRGGSVMTGGSAERLAYVSVSRFVGIGTGVLGEGRRTVEAYSTEMWGHITAGPCISYRVESVVRTRLG